MAVSNLRDTEPVGIRDQPRFLNGVAELETSLDARGLLNRLLSVERALGRDRTGIPKGGPRSIDLDPRYTIPYNQLGYAYRFQGKMVDAEKTFRRYSELLPSDPNPHDSYAELLMQLGRFDESIAEYRKALEIDPLFPSALVGIANDQVLQGKGEEARATLKEALRIARNDGEKRQAWYWIGQTWAHEGRWTQAIESIEEEKKIADAAGDLVSASRDLNLIGNLLLGADKPDEAARQFEAGVALVAKAGTSAEVKETARRNHLFDLARVALQKKDLATARARSRDYAAAVFARRTALW